jgi:hypothetical protein
MTWPVRQLWNSSSHQPWDRGPRPGIFFFLSWPYEPTTEEHPQECHYLFAGTHRVLRRRWAKGNCPVPPPAWSRRLLPDLQCSESVWPQASLLRRERKEETHAATRCQVSERRGLAEAAGGGMTSEWRLQALTTHHVPLDLT